MFFLGGGGGVLVKTMGLGSLNHKSGSSYTKEGNMCQLSHKITLCIISKTTNIGRENGAPGDMATCKREGWKYSEKGIWAWDGLFFCSLLISGLCRAYQGVAAETQLITNAPPPPHPFCLSSRLAASLTFGCAFCKHCFPHSESVLRIVYIMGNESTVHVKKCPGKGGALLEEKAVQIIII